MDRRAWALHLGVVAAYVLVAIAFTWPLALHLDTHLLGDPGGDTGVYVWNQWVFQHEARVLHSSPLTTERILSLSGRPIDLTQHNYTAFLDVLAMPLVPVLGVVATFNVVLMLALALTGYMTFLYTRHVSGGTLEAWLAGLAFAFGPVLIARSTAHVSLMAAAPLPAFILALRRAGMSGHLRDAALAGLCVAWAAFCDAYFAVYCVMAGGLYLLGRLLHVEWRPGTERRPGAWVLDLLILLAGGFVVGLAFGRGGRWELFGVPVSVRGLYTPVMVLTLLVLARAVVWIKPQVVSDLRGLRPSSVGALALGTLVAAVALSPVLYGVGHQVLDGDWVSPAILWRSSPIGADLLALITPNPSHPLVRSIYDWEAAAPTTYVEYTASVSLVALGVIAVAWRRGHRPAGALLAVAAFWLLLALGPFIHVAGYNTHVPGPWAVLRYVPVIGLARSPTRFAIMAGVPMAAMFASALVALGAQAPARRRRLLLGAVAALLVFELWPAPRPLYAAGIPTVYDVIRDDPRPVRVLELPFGVRDGTSSYGNFSARYQFNQTRHGKRLVGGYLSRVSPGVVRDLDKRPVLHALMELSAGRDLAPERRRAALATAPEFLARTDVGWLVLHRDTAPAALAAFANEAFGLELVATDGDTQLYHPTRVAKGVAPGQD